MRLIGIHGKARSGKDTIATYLDGAHNFIHLKFADALKMAVQAAFNLTEDEMMDDKKEQINPFWNVSPRKIYQFIGTEIFHHQLEVILPGIGNTFWIKSLEKYIQNIQKKIHSPNLQLCVSDVRFMSELEWIKKNKGTLIHVKRPGKEGANSGIAGHSSESDLNFSTFPKEKYYEVINDKSTFELYAKIDTIIQ